MFINKLIINIKISIFITNTLLTNILLLKIIYYKDYNINNNIIMEDNNKKLYKVVYRKYDKFTIEEISTHTNSNVDFEKRVVCTITRMDSDESGLKRNINECLDQESQLKKSKIEQNILFGTYNNLSNDWEFAEINYLEMYNIIRAHSSYTSKTDEEIEQINKAKQNNNLYKKIINQYALTNHNVVLHPADFVNYFCKVTDSPIEYLF